MEYEIEIFKPYPIISKKPIILCVDEIMIDDHFINYTGKTEEFEHGEYETCQIKAGTPLWMIATPNGCVHIQQTQKSNQVILSGAKYGKDYVFDKSQPNLLPKASKPVRKQKKNNGPSF